MPENSRFVRVLLDVEVEVLDELAVRASNLDWETTPEGEPAMSEPRGDLPGWPGSAHHGAVARVLMDRLFSGLQNGGETGLKPVSFGQILRPISADGLEYEETVLPAMPKRRDDGEFQFRDED